MHHGKSETNRLFPDAPLALLKSISRSSPSNLGHSSHYRAALGPYSFSAQPLRYKRVAARTFGTAIALLLHFVAMSKPVRAVEPVCSPGDLILTRDNFLYDSTLVIFRGSPPRTLTEYDLPAGKSFTSLFSIDQSIYGYLIEFADPAHRVFARLDCNSGQLEVLPDLPFPIGYRSIAVDGPRRLIYSTTGGVDPLGQPCTAVTQYNIETTETQIVVPCNNPVAAPIGVDAGGCLIVLKGALELDRILVPGVCDAGAPIPPLPPASLYIVAVAVDRVTDTIYVRSETDDGFTLTQLHAGNPSRTIPISRQCVPDPQTNGECTPAGVIYGDPSDMLVDQATGVLYFIDFISWNEDHTVVEYQLNAVDPVTLNVSPVRTYPKNHENYYYNFQIVAGSGATAIDPNPGDFVSGSGRPPEKTLLDPEGRIIGTSSPEAVERLATGGYPVSRIATDGITPLIVRIFTEAHLRISVQGADLSDGALKYGSLIPLGADPLQVVPGIGQETLENVAPVHDTNGTGVVLVAYIAPPALSKVDNPIVITGDDMQGHIVGSVELTLVPPPVVLVHGIWGSPDDFGDIKAELSKLGMEVVALDYGQDGSSIASLKLAENRPVRTLDLWIRDRLLDARSHGIAVTRVNVIAHSFGGLVTRMRELVPEVQYRRPSTFGAGDIHKLITIDTPHFGSPIAPFTLSSCLDLAMNSAAAGFGSPTHNGGLDDLVPLSVALLQLPPHPGFFVHQIVGVANPDQEIRALYRQQAVTYEWCGSCPCTADADCGEDEQCLLNGCDDDWLTNQYRPCEVDADCGSFSCVPIGRCVTGAGTFCERGTQCDTPHGGICGGPAGAAGTGVAYVIPDFLTRKIFNEANDISVGISSSSGNDSSHISLYTNVVHSKSWGTIGSALSSDATGDGEVVLNAMRVRKRIGDLLMGDETNFGHL